MVNEAGQASVESELLDEEIPSWNIYHNAILTLGATVKICSKVTCEVTKWVCWFVASQAWQNHNCGTHTIDTGTAYPVRLPPYRVPHAYRDIVESELKDMLENSISYWALSQPVVCTNGVSAERDSSLRLCVGYCRLNSVSRSMHIQCVEWMSC